MAVNDISFSVEEGEIVGLLGPNGAGKTTTLMMLVGITKPTNGKIKILELDFEENRVQILKNINYASAYSFFQGRLSVYENLIVFSLLYEVKNPKDKISELLENFEISDLKNKMTNTLSSGQLTRLNLCKALINDPKVLLLDEPTASLDPDIAEKVRGLLFKIRRERKISMLYTSHNMAEITQMCDRVIFLNNGKIEADDTPLNLTKMIKECLLTLTFDAPLAKVKKIAKKIKLNYDISQPNTIDIQLEENKIGSVLTEFAKNDIPIIDVDIEKPNLEDVFLKIAHKKDVKVEN